MKRFLPNSIVALVAISSQLHCCSRRDFRVCGIGNTEFDSPFDRHTSNVIRKLTQRQKDLQEQNIDLAKKLQAKEEELLQTKASANLNNFIIVVVVMRVMIIKGHSEVGRNECGASEIKVEEALNVL
ncbi:hypothetical protein V2J09_021868 [Rumex salicifolius]